MQSKPCGNCSGSGTEDGTRSIIELLHRLRGVDFSGYTPALLDRQVRRRMADGGFDDLAAYRAHLIAAPDELDRLLSAFTVNVSSFFRNPLTFDYLAERILPALMAGKKQQKSASLRIWCAGCSFGAEPYSVAILLHELMQRESQPIESYIFATDIDKNVLQQAREGNYPAESIENVNYRQLKKYFREEGELFKLDARIRKMVNFSLHDLLDAHTYVPPESVFGAFDLVFCRNVLIYLEKEYQQIVFDKLYHSLAAGGYLVLGEAEVPPPALAGSFRPVGDCHIYRKY
jgi:chemotaxis methyl-accepting protein methylase